MDTLRKLMNKQFKGRVTLSRQIQAGLTVEYANELIVDLWGKKGAEKIRAISLKNNILTIHVANLMLAQEVKMKQTQLLTAMAAKFKADTVKKIKIVPSLEVENI